MYTHDDDSACAGDTGDTAPHPLLRPPLPSAAAVFTLSWRVEAGLGLNLHMQVYLHVYRCTHAHETVAKK